MAWRRRFVFACGWSAAIALAVAASCVPVRSATPHDFHASLTQVEVNRGDKTVEIAVRVFLDDLEDALSRRAGRRVRLGTASNFDVLAYAYVMEGLTVRTAGGDRLRFVWIGKEPGLDVVWIYVEAPLSGELEGGTLSQTVFCELFDDQLNTVVVKDGKRNTTLTFGPGETSKPVQFAR